MSEIQQTPLVEETQDHSNLKANINLKRIVLRYLAFWPWFVISVLIMSTAAYLYDRFTFDSYLTEASVKFIGESGEMGGVATVGDGLFAQMRGVNLANEGPFLKSRRLIDSVVTSLELQTVYYRKGRINTREIWKNETPFKVVWHGDSLPAVSSPVYLVEFSSAPNFELSLEDGSEAQKAQFNDTIRHRGFEFSLILNPKYTGTINSFKNSDFQFRYYTKDQMINHVNRSLNIDQFIKGSDILSITYQGPNRAKNEAIVDSVISKYDMDRIRDKRRLARQAENFLAKRLGILYQELDSVERGLVSYMRASGMVSVETSAQKLFAKETESEKRYFDLQMQKSRAENFKEELLTGQDYQLLPSNMGLESSAVNNLTNEYNLTVMERDARLISSTLENPQVVKLTSKLDNLKENILKSINGYIRDLDSSLESLKEREEVSTSGLSIIPEQTKTVKGIERQQEIKEKLYLFLLQNHEQAALEYATISSSLKIVDHAHSSTNPIGLKKRPLYLLAVLIGLGVPFGIIYVRFLFYSKIYSKEDLERLLPNLPVLVEIPENRFTADKLVSVNDRSVLAEAFRILRTNLGFYKSSEPGKGQVIYVTSTIKGEGKTFVALNTAHSFAATGVNTVLIGADLRNPQLHKYYNLNKNQVGVSNYLSDSSVKLEDLIIQETEYFKNYDLILAGPIPPNPSELLLSERFQELLEEAKEKYDYVIVDTAPTILVADTLLISKYADVTIYIARSGYTDDKLVPHIKDLYQNKKLNNMGMIINGISRKTGYDYSYSYNYGYGYGYYEDKKSAWWKFWKR